MVMISLAPSKRAGFLQAVDQRVMLAFLHLDVQLRVDTELGRAFSWRWGRRRGRGFPAGARRRHRPSSKPYQRSLKNMAAHLAGQRRASFFHLGLDKAVAGARHDRLAAVLANPRRQIAVDFTS